MLHWLSGVDDAVCVIVIVLVVVAVTVGVVGISVATARKGKAIAPKKMVKMCATCILVRLG